MGVFSRRDEFQPGAYVNTSRSLFEIVERTETLVTLEDCRSGFRHTRPVHELRKPPVGTGLWALTKTAPVVPDRL